jgi:hypothetical protein
MRCTADVPSVGVSARRACGTADARVAGRDVEYGAADLVRQFDAFLEPNPATGRGRRGDELHVHVRQWVASQSATKSAAAIDSISAAPSTR